ncbi:MAG: hypothetical protein KF819_16030 [Labilithrix sp.]|nr:hypothetical protein [Labilithrix sp.]
MATFGKNIRIAVDKAYRGRVRQLFTEVFGCALKTPRDDLDVFVFAGGENFGAYLVDAEHALAEADQKKAAWLELAVEDPAATEQKLAALGITPFDYADKSHSYFCPPWGPVFRLTRA